MEASLPPDVARHAHCLTADELAAVADALRSLAADADAAPPSAPAAAGPFLAAWRSLAQRALRPDQPFALHRALHAAVYARWDASSLGPRPVWVPGPQDALETNAAGFMASWHGDAWWARARTGHPARDWPLLQRASVQSPELFWSAVLRELGVRFDAPPARVLDETGLRGDDEQGGASCGRCGGGGGGGGDGGGCSEGDGGGCCCSDNQQQQQQQPSGGASSSPLPSLGPDSVRWLPGARLNIAAAALLSPKSPDGGAGAGASASAAAAAAAAAAATAGPGAATATPWWFAPCCDGEAYETGRAPSAPPPALIWAEDGRPHDVRRVSWPALRARAARVARALTHGLGVRPGDAVAIDMPMSCDAVAIYLGIVLAGAVVVSIADSFAPSEIASRLRISGARLVFTQDVVPRGGARPPSSSSSSSSSTAPLPLYARVLEARAPRCVVLPARAVGKAWADGEGGGGGNGEGEREGEAGREGPPLRGGDLTWRAFLAAAGTPPSSSSSSSSSFEPASLPGDSPSNILFSSGTTGEPKAVAWSHVTPLRAAVDAWAHQDVRPGDVLCWPTNLGWMMGPWLVYGALLNGASAAVYHGPPGGRDFCAFVAAARVTQLGLVPSIVRSWRAARGLLGPPGDGGGGGGGGGGAAAGGEEGGGEGAPAAAPSSSSSSPSSFYLPDWSALRCFSSTGEASAPDDYHWLASRARGYRPVVEYCGGTEVGGGFLAGSLLQPQAASAFSTPTLGTALVLLGGEAGVQSPHGIGAPPFVGCVFSFGSWRARRPPFFPARRFFSLSPPCPLSSAPPNYTRPYTPGSSRSCPRSSAARSTSSTATTRRPTTRGCRAACPPRRRRRRRPRAPRPPPTTPPWAPRRAWPAAACAATATSSRACPAATTRPSGASTTP
jgi:acyl-coenzyme A synthetase/AMP-(fatty) acid ligase